MQKYLLQELGMSSTYHESSLQKLVANRSLQYIRETEKRTKPRGYKDAAQRRLKIAPWANISAKYSAGAYISNAVDVAIFANNCVLGDYLSDETQKEIFENNLVKTTRNDPDDYYGLGWHVYLKSSDKISWINGKKNLSNDQKIALINFYNSINIHNIDENEPYMISHGGGAIGGASFVMVLPQYDIVVSCLTNLQQSNPSIIAKQIATCFIDDNESSNPVLNKIVKPNQT